MNDHNNHPMEPLLLKVQDTITSIATDPHDIAALDNDFSEYQGSLRTLLSPYAVSYEKCFGKPIKTFTITIPIDYKNTDSIDRYMAQEKKKGAFINSNFCDKKFARASYKPIPGKEYGVEIIPTLTSVESRVCLGFLKSKEAVLTSGQGLVAVLELARKRFPSEIAVVSYDIPKSKVDKEEVDHLCKINGASWVARATIIDSRLRFGLHSYDTNLEKGACLLAFFEK